MPLTIRSDPNALKDFYETHVDALYAFAWFRVGKDPHLAEEVVQETFLDAIGRMEQYDPERGAPLAWLCTLSRNKIRSALRGRNEARELLELWDRIDARLAEALARLDDEPLPQEAMERREVQDLVGMTLANLPETYREALTQKYVDGLSIESIAKARKTSEDAIKSLLARARQAFRAAFLAVAAIPEGTKS